VAEEKIKELGGGFVTPKDLAEKVASAERVMTL